jgi:uncharacterized phage-associated protein
MSAAGTAPESVLSTVGCPEMKPRFNEQKATQAAARFLKLANGKMNYLKLIKLLYLLDRESLKRRGRPVTGDQYYSMKLGPVLSEVHDLITEPPAPGDESFWAKHISDPSHYEVALLDDPGGDKLSEAEEELIDEIHGAYGHYAPFELVDFLHKILPEWKPITSGRQTLSYSDVLTALGKSAEEIKSIEADIDYLAFVDSAFVTR